MYQKNNYTSDGGRRNFINRFSGHSFIFSVYFVLIMVIPCNQANAQLFKQDFSSSSLVADYTSSNPGSGQFNSISTTGAGTAVSITGEKLQFSRSGSNVGSFSRTSAFSPTPATLLYKFDISVTANTASATSAAVFQLGSGFGTGNSAESNTSTYARLAVNILISSGQFQLRDITNGTNSATFSGTQTVTWALNNSGTSQVYTSPAGTTENIADDKADVWIGTTKVFDDVNVQTASQTISNIKFVFSNGEAAIQLDNFEISSFCEAPEVNSVAFSGKTSVSGTFSASLLHTGGSNASVTKRGFEFAENTALTNASEIYESGNFTSGTFNLNINNLKPNTTYYYRAFAINNCISPRTSWSHTSAFPSFTTIADSPSTAPATSVGSSGFTANWQAPVTGGNAAFTYSLEVSDNSSFSNIVFTQKNIISSLTSYNVTGLNAATAYWYRLKAVNNGGESSYSDIAGPVTTQNPNPQISVSATLNSFSTNLGKPAAEQSYTLSASNLTGALTVSAPSGFEVSLSSGTSFSSSVQINHINGNIGNTYIYVRLNSAATGNYSGNIIHSSSGATVQNVAVSGVTNSSNTSDIIANTIFSYTANINYTQYQSAIITNTTNSLGVFGFILRDGAGSSDADNLPTVLSEITFDVSGLSNIRTAALFSGNNLISNSPVLNLQNGTISFSGLSGTNVTANDNSTKAINIRVAFNAEVKDNEQLLFTVKSATAAAGNLSSSFLLADAGAATSYNTADMNRIEVIANSIKWNKQPENSTVGANLPSFSIIASDANGNRDFDENSCGIILSSTGNGFTSASSYTFNEGLITVSDAVFNLASQNITISVVAQNCLSNTQIISAGFNITGIAYAIGDKRTTANGNWSNGNWETCTSLNPVTFSSTGSNGEAPSNSTGTVHIEHTVILDAPSECGTVYIKKTGELAIQKTTKINEKLQVFEGGTLNIEAPLIIASGKSFIVENEATLILNYSGLGSSDSLWNGIENFSERSSVIIKNWDYNATAPAGSFIDGSNIRISANASGYLFGNLNIEVNPASDFILIFGNTVIKLCSNNLTINNNTSLYNVVLSNASAEVEIGGDLNLDNGLFSFAYSGGTNKAGIIVKGNLKLNSGTAIINKTISSSAETKVYVYKNLLSAIGSTLKGSNTGDKIIFSGNTVQETALAGSLGDNIRFESAAGSIVKLVQRDLDLSNSNNSFTINNGSRFEFNGYNITGNGSFILNAGGTLKITSAEGITNSGNTGNVQTSVRVFDGGGTYWYNGNTAQFTGNGLPAASNDKIVIIDNPVSVQPSTLTRINANGRLEIRQGILNETATEYFTDATYAPVAGSLVMSGGTYRIMRTDVTVPQLSGVYSITGGTIELAAQGDQKLRGGRTYNNLSFTGSGSKTTGSAISNISGAVSISGNAVLDVENSTFSGQASLTMTGGRLRMRTLNTTLPQLTGIYNLSGGTVELYGTSATQTHTLRGGVTYYNVEINAAATNSGTGAANVLTNSSFSVSNEMRIKSPASYLIGQTYNINGTADFILDGGATLKYGSADGIKLSGTGIQDGNIRVSGTRSFSSEANYAFTGSAEMQSGNGLPSLVNRIMVEKSNAASSVILTSGVTVTTSVSLTSGLLKTDANKIILGATANLTETANSYITGTVETERRLSTGTENFGGLGLQITPATAPGNTKVTRVTGNSAIQTGQTGFSGIGRYFDISAEKNSGLNATMIFTYNDVELNNYPETDLVLFKSKDGGKIWEYQGASTNDAVANTITLSGVDGFSRWTAGSIITPLPVKLISFTANLESANNANLTWITASELNNDYFEIERSENGKTFYKIGQVKGNGTKNSESRYFFKDEITDLYTTNKSIYYRLKQIDFNGKNEYSQVIKLNISSGAENNKTWYNSYTNSIHFSFNAKENVARNFIITDMYGRIVMQHRQQFNAGKNDFTIPANQLPAGIYIVSSENETGEIINTRIVK